MRTTTTGPLVATRWAAPLLVAGAVLALLSACVPPPPSPAEGFDPNDAPRAGEAAYRERGPYEVGVTTVELADRSMEVWYPVDPGDAVGPNDEYHIRRFISAAFDALIPPEVDPPFVTDAVRDVPASDDGPFPLVLFSHGFASYRLQSTFLTTHLASWGFVVASPDYLERGLRAVLGEPPARARNDVDVADEAIDTVRELGTTAGHRLEGTVEQTAVFPVGHSAGGGTSLRLLGRADVAAAIPLASGLSLVNLLEGRLPLPPGKAVTWIAAPADRIVSIDDVRRGYDYTAGERRIVELGGSGHVNAFSDICEIGDGGVAELARSTGIPIPEGLLLLGDDGCPVPPYRDSPEVWEEVRHFVTAELRYRSGLDDQPVGLGDAVRGELDDVVRYRHDP